MPKFNKRHPIYGDPEPVASKRTPFSILRDVHTAELEKVRAVTSELSVLAGPAIGLAPKL